MKEAGDCPEVWGNTALGEVVRKVFYDRVTFELRLE